MHASPAHWLAALVVMTGCSAVVEDVPDDTQDSETMRATVSVQRTESARGGVRTHVAARFLRAAGAMDEAERMVDAGALDPEAPLGCADMVAEPRHGGSDDLVELLDVGEIVLHAQDRARMALAPRAFPDVGGLVSGVVYTSRDGRRDLPEATTYLFEVTGSSTFDGVSLVADAPAAPDNVRVGGVALSRGDLTVSSGERVEVTWSASGDADDRIYLTVSDELDGRAFTCVFDDDGAGEIPASLLAFEAGAELDLMVHRHRREALDVPGTDYDAVVDFDFAVAAQITVE